MTARELYMLAAWEFSQQSVQTAAFAMSADADELTGPLAWQMRDRLVLDLRRYRIASNSADSATKGTGQDERI